MSQNNELCAHQNEHLQDHDLGTPAPIWNPGNTKTTIINFFSDIKKKWSSFYYFDRS